MESVFLKSNYKDIYRNKKKKCIFYETYKYCKNYETCPYYHPTLCKYKERCRFKNTTCRFYHPQHFSLKKEHFPEITSSNSLTENDSDLINCDLKLSFRDVCEHSKDGKMYFYTTNDTDYNEIFEKIKNSLENKTSNVFVFKPKT
jgi:hypothetical protein